ncbi:Cof-type HAD-IIB family hydrolase [Colidextribacter sp. OB.20]|uniref:Cof-type HAD-IIB family hydrolase n=1 Tax=Colidextribacter sp. OB.20 TaxID=2304568 RepID=UPI0013714A70|nr:Cof-type HAD-IIB family hydrolase [Colidextribacter sp. OB.20]NBI11908.1 Cof-type HAD-IIB family hydrolase [Colidextribacter sp. OB.20]
MIKLISLDLDGTLLDPKGKITAASREAVARAKAAGLRVVINTGRPVQEAVCFAREAGCDLLVSGAGGGLVVDGETGRTIRQWDVPESPARRAMELCLSWDAQLLIFAGGEILVNAAGKRYMEDCYPFPVFHDAVIVTEDFLGYMEEHRLPLVKIHGEKGPGWCPAEELDALPGVSTTTSSAHDFELTAGGADKGAALAVIAERYGIPLDQCAAVGDSENDLPVFRVAGMPIAMGNAPEHVKAAALRLAPSNREEGAAWAVLSCLE